jgi:predicted secreted protein
MSDIKFHSIKNGNTIVLQSAANPSTTFHLLLRWRNHKGILNPAWQISLKRTRDAHNAI